MCLFCAAVPMTVSLGIAAQAGQERKREAAKAEGKPLPRLTLPIRGATYAATLGLGVAAVVYHTTIAPKIGIW